MTVGTVAADRSETITSSGLPLGFKVGKGSTRPPAVAGGTGCDVFRVEARHLAGHHQKEAVVTEGDHGSSWRMVSDEGVHIKGDDLAPFPLGFFNAGLQADLANRLLFMARVQGVALDDVQTQCRTGYRMTGSFYKGDGIGSATPASLTVRLRSSSPAVVIKALVANALNASPALAAMRIPLENTFALYVNGKRYTVNTLQDAGMPDAADPLTTYPAAPSPLAGTGARDGLIVKTGRKRDGTPALTSPAGTTAQPIMREVEGVCHVSADSTTCTDVALKLPGMSHFALRSDESAADRAPSGLALLSAGIAFCYMTQLSRYIDYMKYRIRHIRLVQYNPYSFDGTTGRAEPIATHLFLSGDESGATHERLMRISAATCFLHATLRAALVPEVAVELNGISI